MQQMWGNSHCFLLGVLSHQGVASTKDKQASAIPRMHLAGSCIMRNLQKPSGSAFHWGKRRFVYLESPIGINEPGHKELLNPQL